MVFANLISHSNLLFFDFYCVANHIWFRLCELLIQIFYTIFKGYFPLSYYRCLYMYVLYTYSVIQLCSTLCDLKNCSPPGSSVHGDSPGKNTGVGGPALLQGLFPTQGSNPGLPHCRQILYCLSHQGSPGITKHWLYFHVVQNILMPISHPLVCTPTPLSQYPPL